MLEEQGRGGCEYSRGKCGSPEREVHLSTGLLRRDLQRCKVETLARLVAEPLLLASLERGNLLGAELVGYLNEALHDLHHASVGTRGECSVMPGALFAANAVLCVAGLEPLRLFPTVKVVRQQLRRLLDWVGGRRFHWKEPHVVVRLPTRVHDARRSRTCKGRNTERAMLIQTSTPLYALYALTLCFVLEMGYQGLASGSNATAISANTAR